MSCFDCINSQPTGCSLNRPEFETYADCASFEMDSAIHTAESFMEIFGFKRVVPASSTKKGDGDESNG